MPTFIVSGSAVQISQSLTQTASLQNNGTVPIYLGDDASVTSQNYDQVLHPGGTAVWNQGALLWVVCESGTSAPLAVIYGARDVQVTSVNIPGPVDVDVLNRVTVVNDNNIVPIYSGLLTALNPAVTIDTRDYVSLLVFVTAYPTAYGAYDGWVSLYSTGTGPLAGGAPETRFVGRGYSGADDGYISYGTVRIVSDEYQIQNNYSKNVVVEVYGSYVPQPSYLVGSTLLVGSPSTALYPDYATVGFSAAEDSIPAGTTVRWVIPYVGAGTYSFSSYKFATISTGRLQYNLTGVSTHASRHTLYRKSWFASDPNNVCDAVTLISPGCPMDIEVMNGDSSDQTARWSFTQNPVDIPTAF